MFLTVAAFRIKRAGVICARVVSSRFMRLYPRVQRETSSTIVHPSQLDLTTVHVVQLEVYSHYAFDRMHACHVDCGKPFLHKSPSDSSKKCPSIHEVWK